MSKITEIRVSFTEPGSVLKSSGKYTTANIKVHDPNSLDDKAITVLEPSKTIKEAQYLSSKKIVLLKIPFINYWMERKSWEVYLKGKSPKNAQDKIKMSIFNNFKTLSAEKVLEAAVRLYLADISVDYNTAEITFL